MTHEEFWDTLRELFEDQVTEYIEDRVEEQTESLKNDIRIALRDIATNVKEVEENVRFLINDI